MSRGSPATAALPGAAVFTCVLLISRYYFSGRHTNGSIDSMSNTIILIVLAVIVLIIAVVFIFLSVKSSDASHAKSQNSREYARVNEYTSIDIRSKKIKCHRCRGEAFGVLGTGNIYRCRSCGAKTEGPTVEPRNT